MSSKQHSAFIVGRIGLVKGATSDNRFTENVNNIAQGMHSLEKYKIKRSRVGYKRQTSSNRYIKKSSREKKIRRDDRESLGACLRIVIHQS